MRKLYPIIAIVAGLLITGQGVAQDQPATAGQTFTLQQCIDYALENAVSVKNAALDQEIAQARVNETIGIGLPQIKGEASILHNEKLPRFFSTYAVAQAFGGTDANGDPLLVIPGAEPDDILASPQFFQLKSSGDVNVSINQIIFNGSYLVGLKASKTYKELSYRAAIQNKEKVVQQVIKAYYTVLINKERAALFTSNIGRVDSLLKNTRAMFENGFAESIDADRIQVQLNNLVAERDKFLNIEQLGLALLKFQMNYPMADPIQVVGNIEDLQTQVRSQNVVEDVDYKARPDYQSLEVNKRLQELNVKNKFSANLPSLNAFYKYGYLTQSPNISGIFKTNSTFAETDAYGADKWYSYSNYGLSLSIPIFSGLQNKYKVQQEKIALNKINNDFVNLKSAIDLEVKQSLINYDNALKSLNAQQQNIVLAEKVARVTRIKYEQGVGSNLEVTDAEDSLRQAQTNYYNALFDAMVAKTDLDKAYGKLVPQTESK
jgi:outer membrane protein